MISLLKFVKIQILELWCHLNKFISIIDIASVSRSGNCFGLLPLQHCGNGNTDVVIKRSYETDSEAEIMLLTLYGHIKTAQQRTIIQLYGDRYTAAPPSPLLAVPNVTAHPSTASVPNSYHSMWHYNCHCTLKG